MELQTLYNQIKNNTVSSDLIIFNNCKKCNFLVDDYINEIAQQHQLTRTSIEDLSTLLSYTSLFAINTNLNIYTVDKFDLIDERIKNLQNVIICCNSIPKNIYNQFNYYIVDIPTLEEWQIKDLAYSQLEGLTTESLDKLCAICQNDLYRLQLEIDRIKIFPVNERELIFQTFLQDNIYDDLTSITIFNFIDAITSYNIPAVSKLYNDLVKLDSNNMGILQLLYKNFKYLMLLTNDDKISANQLNISSGQYYAIHNKALVTKYSKEKLISIFELLTDIDRQVKLGLLDTNLILDYLLVYIFSK